MRLIFLDIDGVLNSMLSMHAGSILGKPVNRPYSEINTQNLDILRMLVEKTNAKIVISSVWRKSTKMKKGIKDNDEIVIKNFKNFFKHFGWNNAPIIGVTPDLNAHRGQEVATYLDKLSETTNISDYIIFDDDSDFFLGNIKDISPEIQERIKMNNFDDLSQYWSNQRLLLINRLVGLSYNDLIEVLKVWEPQDDFLKMHESYIPYIPNYGKRFK